MYVYLTLDQVLVLHDRSISKHGGSFGIRDIGLIESALMAPQQTFGGEDLYPSLESKVAAMWHGFVANHGFVDGNKRIGLIVASVFLLMNGFRFTLSQALAEEITLKIATSELSRAELVGLVGKWIAPLDGQSMS